MNALILVDLQNDFMPGGPLAVPHGDEVIPVANRLQQRFEIVTATGDWHPPDHCSFAVNQPGHEVGEEIEVAGIAQILWPVHCVAGTPGAQFHPDLNQERIAKVIHKGTDVNLDSYSTFFDNAHRRSTGLGEYLKQQGVKAVYLAGLATDYCVRFSALDAIELGFETCVVLDGCRGIDRRPGDVDRTMEELERKGARVLRSDAL